MLYSIGSSIPSIAARLYDDKCKYQNNTYIRCGSLSFFVFCNTLARGLRAGLVTSYCRGTKCKKKKTTDDRVKRSYTRRDKKKLKTTMAIFKI